MPKFENNTVSDEILIYCLTYSKNLLAMINTKEQLGLTTEGESLTRIVK